LEIGYTDHFQTVTKSNYNTIANFLALQITRAHAKSFQSALSSPVVPWRRLLTVEILQLHRLSLHFTDSSRKHRSLLYSSRFRGNVFVCEGVTQKRLRVLAF
jgi:hypothetical protein